jgi:hypothetical protein
LRLERGRAVLRARLLRRGLGPVAAVLASAWPAAEFLARLVEGRIVDCFMIEAQYAYVGYVGDVEIGHAMVINGWARGRGAAETIAREQKRGQWADR